MNESDKKQALPSRTKKRLIICLIITIFFVIGFVILNLKHVLEIDRFSGKVRDSWQIAGVILKSEVQETEFSKLATPYVTTSVPDWKKDCQFSLFGPRISPHYRYHGAIHHTKEIAFIIAHYKMNSEERENLLRNTLEHLSDNSQGDYFFEVINTFESNGELNPDSSMKIRDR